MAADYNCECCGRELAWGKVFWLELDQRIDEFHDFELGVPQESSQGAFPFGVDCARRACEKARAAAEAAGIFLGRKRIGEVAQCGRRMAARRSPTQ